LYISGYSYDILGDTGVLDENLVLPGKPFSKDELANKVREVLGKG
jgi:hypothetical protein